MSAYQRDGLSLEAYLIRILAALCKQNGGSIRVKGELIDSLPDHQTLLSKEWCSETQELVLRANLGTFSEVFRVIPEKQPNKEVVAADPLKKDAEREIPFDKIRSSGSTLDNEKLSAMEATLQKRRIASMLAEELRGRRRQNPEATL